MKSIKPGRGPSAMGAIGGIFAAIFGVFWTIMAARTGAPKIFAMFGVLFVVMAIVQVVYNYKNASGRNRMSVYDITDEHEEKDPVDKYIKYKEINEDDYNNGNISGHGEKFCPYCGKELKGDFQYCPKCGREVGNI